MQQILTEGHEVMKEILMKVTSKGQVTIPAEVRRALGIGKSQKVAFVIEEGGEVKLKAPRYADIDAVVGKAGKLPKRLSWEKMRQIAYDDAAIEVAKSHAQ
jgi:AbrB family looped-hinge helix DNA binding protein